MRSLCFTVSLLVSGTAIAAAQTPPQPPKADPADLRRAELFIAITQRRPGDARAALARGADPNGRNWLDFTPLMWAAARGERQTVDTLLAHGARLDTSSIYGSALTLSPLHHVTLSSDLLWRPCALGLLVCARYGTL